MRRKTKIIVDIIIAVTGIVIYALLCTWRLWYPIVTPAHAGNAPSYTAATTPYTGSELWYCDQAGADRSCVLSSIMSNAQLDRVSGLTSATVPQFLYRNAAGSYVGSLLGTSQFQYNNYGGAIEASKGTSGAGDTTVGAVAKFSRTGTPAVGNCANLADSECDSAVAIYALGLAADTVQTTGLYAAAKGSSTNTGVDVLGGTLSGRVTGSGVGLGTGGYFEGRRDTTTGGALAAEARAMNITTANCSYNTSGIGGCDSLWLTSSGDGVHTTVLSTALHIGNADPLTSWAAGITINSNAVAATGYSIDDEGAGTYGIYENGNHTYALLIGAGAGLSGFGTLTPTYQVDVAGQVRTTKAFLNSSNVPTISACGTSPPVATAGSNNNGGQFTVGTATPTACTVTFANAFPTTAWCTISPASSNAAVAGVYISAQSAAAFTITQPALSSTKYNYTCMGN
jgi:hypothetical protein